MQQAFDWQSRGMASDQVCRSSGIFGLNVFLRQGFDAIGASKNMGAEQIEASFRIWTHDDMITQLSTSEHLRVRQEIKCLREHPPEHQGYSKLTVHTQVCLSPDAPRSLSRLLRWFSLVAEGAWSVRGVPNFLGIREDAPKKSCTRASSVQVSGRHPVSNELHK